MLLVRCTELKVLLLRGCKKISAETINMLASSWHSSVSLCEVDVTGTQATLQQVKLLLQQYQRVGMDARYIQQLIWHDVNWQRISPESLCLACCKTDLWNDVNSWRTHPSISPINMGNIQRSMQGGEGETFLQSKPFKE